MRITLTILAKDIKKDNYFDSEKCPITKALKRAGYPELRDGGRIMYRDEVICSEIDNKSYHKLLIKLFGMYNSMPGSLRPYSVKNPKTGDPIYVDPLPIEDFTITLNLRKWK